MRQRGGSDAALLRITWYKLILESWYHVSIKQKEDADMKTRNHKANI